MTLPEKDSAEIVPVTFEFARLTSAPLTPVLSIAAVSGPEDPDILDMVIGAPQVVGSQVRQKIGAGVAGAIYRLRCQVDTADGLRYVLTGELPVRNEN